MSENGTRIRTLPMKQSYGNIPPSIGVCFVCVCVCVCVYMYMYMYMYALTTSRCGGPPRDDDNATRNPLLVSHHGGTCVCFDYCWSPIAADGWWCVLSLSLVCVWEPQFVLVIGDLHIPHRAFDLPSTFKGMLVRETYTHTHTLSLSFRLALLCLLAGEAPRRHPARCIFLCTPSVLCAHRCVYFTCPVCVCVCV